ncbi:MAG: VWA domain-containing protein [Vicinamibacterales bacterium]
MRRTLVLALILLAAGVPTAQEPGPSTAQQEAPPVTFRLDVNFVELDAYVTDQAGNPVTDLTADDFEILEDGRRQDVSTFSLVNIPVERGERPLFVDEPVEPDVLMNTEVSGRVYLIVFDDWHIDPARAANVRAAARRFIERNLGVNDLAAVVYTSGRAADGQDFTNSRRRLVAAIDRFTGQKIRSGTLQALDFFNRPGATPDERIIDPAAAERAYFARSSMSAVRELAEFMSGVRGRRKTMVLISEGIAINVSDVFANTTAGIVQQEIREAVGAATRGNVSIYTIDPRGLATADELVEVSGVPDNPQSDLGVRSFNSELRLAQDSLRFIANGTGGFASINRNDFDSAFDRIVRENSTYYMLGYSPTNERRDGRFRRLQVRVTRPGLIVRTRDGYLAPRGRADAPVAPDPNPLVAAVNEAVASPLAVTALPMRLFAAAYKGTAPNATVALSLELSAADVAFMEADGTHNGTIELAVTASDQQGKARPGERSTLHLALRPETHARALARGLRVLSQIELPPGRHQVRVAAAATGGRAGSIVYEIDVPDFYESRFSLSGIALTSREAGVLPTTVVKDPLASLLPGPPSALREFRRDDELALYGEVYENRAGSPAHGIDITTELRAEGGQVVYQTDEERSSTELTGGRGGFGFEARLPLQEFEPGLYVLRVRARSRLDAPGDGVVHDIQLRIR